MKFSASEDIEAPAEHVFRMCSDFDGFERSALRRGVDVSPRANLKSPTAERGWNIGFELRGRPREVATELVSYNPPNSMKFATEATGMSGDIRIELIALSRHRTRLAIAVELHPTSIGGRLTLQSFKLAKTSLNKKLRARVSGFAAQVEDASRSV